MAIEIGSRQQSPRWKTLLKEAVQADLDRGSTGALHYTISTATIDAAGVPHPHSRTVGHRCFLNEPLVGESPPAAPKDIVVDDDFESTSTLLFTTDVRSQKAAVILQDYERDPKSLTRGAIVWYLPSKRLQLRLSGTLHLLVSPKHPASQHFDDTLLTPAAKSSSDKPTKRFDWQRLRTAFFSSLSPWLVAGLLRPSPGSIHPHHDELVAADSWPGEEEQENVAGVERPWSQGVSLESEHWDDEKEAERQSLAETANKNFALVLFRPDEVDIVDLKTDRRSVSVRSDDGLDTWAERRIVP